jgi:hypothetical protein
VPVPAIAYVTINGAQLGPGPQFPVGVPEEDLLTAGFSQGTQRTWFNETRGSMYFEEFAFSALNLSTRAAIANSSAIIPAFQSPLQNVIFVATALNCKLRHICAHYLRPRWLTILFLQSIRQRNPPMIDCPTRNHKSSFQPLIRASRSSKFFTGMPRIA